MIRKILLGIWGCIITITIWGQDTAEIMPITDSLNTAHTEFSLNQNNGTDVHYTKAQGDSAYMNNDYVSAIQIYEKLLEQGEAADLYYNLGNCYYKTENLARAILNYERALLLQPGNSDFRANLEIARSKTVDKVTPIPEVFFVSWINSLIGCFNADTWAKWGIACFILLLVSLCLFLISKRIALKKTGFISALIMLLLVIISNLFAQAQKSKLLNKDEAIVLVPSITVRSTPSESGTSLFVIHEGHKVQIKDNSMQEWKEITLEDGKVGWIPANTIEII